MAPIRDTRPARTSPSRGSARNSLRDRRFRFPLPRLRMAERDRRTAKIEIAFVRVGMRPSVARARFRSSVRCVARGRMIRPAGYPGSASPTPSKPPESSLPPPAARTAARVGARAKPCKSSLITHGSGESFAGPRSSMFEASISAAKTLGRRHAAKLNRRRARRFGARFALFLLCWALIFLDLGDPSKNPRFRRTKASACAPSHG